MKSYVNTRCANFPQLVLMKLSWTKRFIQFIRCFRFEIVKENIKKLLFLSCLAHSFYSTFFQLFNFTLVNVFNGCWHDWLDWLDWHVWFWNCCVTSKKVPYCSIRIQIHQYLYELPTENVWFQKIYESGAQNLFFH